MKKLFPLLLAVALLSTACQLGGGPAEPTAIVLPTAGPTATPVPLNPTAEPSGGNVEAGAERVGGADGMIQVYIPEGPFQMGGLDPNAATDEKPVRRVTMHAFWMDKIEVTNAMYALCVQGGACNLPQAFKSETRNSYFNNPEFSDYPVIYVGWNDAATYCEWAGRRLPTEAEWERAARGDDFRTYPWGDERADSSRANINFFIGDTTRVGSFPAGASAFGLLDLAGNVGEWVNDYYDSTYYSAAINNNPPGPTSRTNYFNRVIRGGSFQDTDAYVRVSKRASILGPNFNADLDSREYLGETSPKIGFRCASD
jgi:formylglycine-generating enzyme required for sulfatase activity